MWEKQSISLQSKNNPVPFGAGQSPFGQPPRSNTARTVTVYHTLSCNSIKFLIDQSIFSSSAAPALACPHFDPPSIFYLISVCYYSKVVQFYLIHPVLQYSQIILHSSILIGILLSKKRSVSYQVFQMIHITQKLPLYHSLPAPTKKNYQFFYFFKPPVNTEQLHFKSRKKLCFLVFFDLQIYHFATEM